MSEVKIRLEQMPNLKQKVEEYLSALVGGTESMVVDWETSTDVGERSITVKITPRFKELPDESMFGVVGVKGSDGLFTPRGELERETTEPDLTV